MCSLLEQHNKDLGRQVSVLLNEQQRRASPGLAENNPRLALAAINGSPAGRMAADDIVSEGLIAFADIQVLFRWCSTAWRICCSFPQSAWAH